MDSRKTAALTAAAVAAASIVATAAFETPLQLAEPVPLVETLEAERVEEPEPDTEQEERRGPFARARARLRALTEEARALIVGLPLWGAAQAALAAVFSFLYSVAGPAVSHVLTWLLALGVLVAVMGASVKAALPDVPVKELAKPRNLFPLLGAVLLLGLADFALCTFSEAAFPCWIWHVGAGGALVAVCGVTIRREKRRALQEAKREAERRALEPPTIESIQKAARRLADSVCPVRFT